ncbi:hypothetical protein KAR91_64595 [Candidatus Pacearchaeota archaeon]|nr:hypothetical protein [Candidatus Pacearchaeota archaeon]
MRIDPKQITNPGIFDYDQKRKEKMNRYKGAVKRAMFLNDEEKGNWIVLGYMLTDEQLEEAEKLIINQDLKRFKKRQALEKIKPLKEKKND